MIEKNSYELHENDNQQTSTRRESVFVLYIQI